LMLNKLFYSFLISPLSEGICQTSHTSGSPVPGAEDGLNEIVLLFQYIKKNGLKTLFL